MTVTRRSFLIGASGLISAVFVARVAEHIADTQEPLLLRPDLSEKTLFYHEVGDQGLTLSLGRYDPFSPAPPTWRDYLAMEGHDLNTDDGFQAVLDRWSFTEEDLADQLDTPIDAYSWDSLWEHRFSPTARAYELLRPLDLGVSLRAPGGKAGLLTFNDWGGHPGSDDRWVDVPDPLSISLLQARLIELGLPIEVRSE